MTLSSSPNRASQSWWYVSIHVTTSSRRRGADPAVAHPADLLRDDEPCLLEDADVLAHASEGHVEPLGELRDRELGAPQLFQHAPTGAIRQRGERGIEIDPGILNHIVQYPTTRFAAVQAGFRNWRRRPVVRPRGAERLLRRSAAPISQSCWWCRSSCWSTHRRTWLCRRRWSRWWSGSLLRWTWSPNHRRSSPIRRRLRPYPGRWWRRQPMNWLRGLSPSSPWCLRRHRLRRRGHCRHRSGGPERVVRPRWGRRSSGSMSRPNARS